MSMHDNIIPLRIPSGSGRVAAQIEDAVKAALAPKAYSQVYFEFVLAEVQPVIERAVAIQMTRIALPDSLAGLDDEQVHSLREMLGACQAPLMGLLLRQAVLRASALWQAREHGLEIQAL
jgi:hypothetical protein